MLFPVASLCLYRQLQLMYIPTSQGTDFFYPYVTQILKQKYIFKDLFITHDLGNLQRFVKFLLNSQKYQIPKLKKKKMIILTHPSLFSWREEERGPWEQVWNVCIALSPALIFIGLVRTFIIFCTDFLENWPENLKIIPAPGLIKYK